MLNFAIALGLSVAPLRGRRRYGRGEEGGVPGGNIEVQDARRASS